MSGATAATKSAATREPRALGEIERRVTAHKVQLREAADGGGKTLDGYGAVFNQETVIGGGMWGFRERIAPGAFTAAITADDVRGLFNHDANIVLGRNTNGTLRLAEDGVGLRYEIDLNPDDPDAIRVGAKVKRGDVSQSSFAFTVEEDGEQWDFTEVKAGKLPLRTITRASLYDVSPVTYPAYPQTSVSARAQQMSKTHETHEAQRVAEAAARSDHSKEPITTAAKALVDVAHRDILTAHHSVRAALTALGITGVPDDDEYPLSAEGGTRDADTGDSAMYFAGHAMRHGVAGAAHAASNLRTMCRDAEISDEADGSADGGGGDGANAARIDLDLRTRELELERLR